MGMQTNGDCLPSTHVPKLLSDGGSRQRSVTRTISFKGSPFLLKQNVSSPPSEVSAEHVFVVVVAVFCVCVFFKFSCQAHVQKRKCVSIQ